MTSPLNEFTARAGAKLSALRMTRIVGVPDQHDANNLMTDLIDVARIVDELVYDIGRYAKETLGISSNDLKEHFKDQLSNALEGNALYVIQSAGEELAEETERSLNDEHSTLSRAYQGV